MATDERVCAYCGGRKAKTRDHVIPKCLFIRPFPPNLLTVSACLSCNRAKAEDDLFLRDYLTADIAGNQHPQAKKLFDTKVRRSIRRNSSELGRVVLTSAREKPLYTKAGIFLGDAVVAPLDESRMTRVFSRMIRGLYFHYTGESIPLDYPTTVLRIMPWEFQGVWDGFRKFQFATCGPLADVFVGGCARASEDRFATAWLLTFFQVVHFALWTTIPESGTQLRINFEALATDADYVLETASLPARRPRS